MRQNLKLWLPTPKAGWIIWDFTAVWLIKSKLIDTCIAPMTLMKLGPYKPHLTIVLLATRVYCDCLNSRIFWQNKENPLNINIFCVRVSVTSGVLLCPVGHSHLDPQWQTVRAFVRMSVYDNDITDQFGSYTKEVDIVCDSSCWQWCFRNGKGLLTWLLVG